MGPVITEGSNVTDQQDAAPREARYANYFEVGTTGEEIVIEFGQAYGDSTPVSLHTRIVTSPLYARELARLLQAATDGPRHGTDG